MTKKPSAGYPAPQNLQSARVRKIHLPRTLLRALAPVIERSARLPGGSIRAFVDSMKADAIGDPAPIRAILPRPPLSYRQAVERALTEEKS